MMNLQTLLAPFLPTPLPEIPIENVSNDSRTVREGTLFLAYPGLHVDGRDFIHDACQNGAVAVVYESKNYPEPMDLGAGVMAVGVDNLSHKIAAIAARFYDYQPEKMALYAVTGTNGKTTIAWLLAQAYQQVHQQAAYIGTLGEGVNGQLHHLANTTPDILSIQQLLHQYRSNTVSTVAMEVSSHALDQGRVDGLRFRRAIYTNLSHDHLDYHKSFAAYAEAKAKLFAMPGLETAILNKDDPYVHHMADVCQENCDIIYYGFHAKADVRVMDVTMDVRGIHANVHSPWGATSLHLPLIGQFNLYNALAVFSCLAADGISLEMISSILATLSAPPGRMEVVHKSPLVVVDFAHSPDALQNVLSTLKQLTDKRVHVVFGCGGDRDYEKRPLMGMVASEYADALYITSDNPRSEPPLDIIDAIKQGVDASRDALCIEDRTTAIHHALDNAAEGDTVLISGKGHETYQLSNGKKQRFSDQQVVRDFYANTKV